MTRRTPQKIDYKMLPRQGSRKDSRDVHHSCNVVILLIPLLLLLPTYKGQSGKTVALTLFLSTKDARGERLAAERKFVYYQRKLQDMKALLYDNECKISTNNTI